MVLIKSYYLCNNDSGLFTSECVPHFHLSWRKKDEISKRLDRKWRQNSSNREESFSSGLGRFLPKCKYNSEWNGA